MPLDDADRKILEEIERALLDGDRDLAQSFRAPLTRPPVSLAAPVVAAVAVFVSALGILSIGTGSAIPALLALPPAAVALLLLYRPQTFASAPPGPQVDTSDDPPPSTSST